MNRSGEESEAEDPNRFVEEDSFPPLNLLLTKHLGFINLIGSIIQQDYPCPHQQKLPYSTETLKNTEKPKAVNFPISKITIGPWTRNAVYPDDLKAKFYFAKKKLMWEFLDDVETGTRVARLKRKIEIQWSDVLSFKPTFHPHDETGILKVELSKRPTFFLETNPQAGRHTQWKQMDQDFTQDQYASKCRRHTLHFAPGVLQKNLEKLVSSDSFWSQLIKVDFPSLEDPYFDSGYGNINNNNNGSNLSHYSHDQTLSFNVNNDLCHHYSLGFGHVGVGEVNFNMATQLCANDGWQMSSFVQDNLYNYTANQLNGTQVIQPPSQPINENCDMGRYFSGSQFYNPMIQDENQMRDTGELRGSQAHAQALLETQTNSAVVQHTNDLLVYPQVGPYLQGYLAQEGETQNMEDTHLDGDFHINMAYFNQFGNFDYDQYFSNNNGSMPPDL